MAEHVPEDPLFVFEVTTSCKRCLKKLETGLLERRGIVSVEVSEEKKELHVRGNVEPLELITETQTIIGDKARLSDYNKDPARVDDFTRENNGEEKEEDHYKPYVYKEHKPVYYRSSMSGKEFFDYFAGVPSGSHNRNAVPTVDPFAEYLDCSHTKHFSSAVPMLRKAYPPHFY